MYCENAKDEIRIEGLEVFAHHGVFPKETKNGQTFLVNATLYGNTSEAGKTDDLTLSTDYGAVCLFITEWMQNNTCKLLEAVAERMAKDVLLKFDLISAIDLEIRKPDAPIPLPFECVSVKVNRGWHKAYIAVGSNMGDREAYIRNAISALEDHAAIVVTKVSPLLETKPYGVTEQADFLNGVLEVETLLDPEALLQELHGIEQAAERKRELRWGPRTLDLDIVFYDKLVYESETLIIPHVDMENREFVLGPLSKIAPNYRHPVLGKTVAQLLMQLGS